MMTSNIAYADELIKEYLVYRGFTKSLAAFENEKKTDRLKGFQVNKIVDQLFHYVHTYQLTNLLDMWEYLSRNFFSRTDKDLSFAVRKLELSLKRYYIVHCILTAHPDKAAEFFEYNSQEMWRDPEWKPWFAILYLRQPSSDPYFEPYFTKGWLEAFSVSLHNFLATVFSSMWIHYVERMVRRNLEAEIQTLQEELRRQKDSLESAVAQLESLRAMQSTKDMTLNATARVADSSQISQLPPSFTRSSLSDSGSSASQSAASWKPTSAATAAPLPEGLAPPPPPAQPEPFSVLQQDILSGHNAPVIRVAFSPHGSLFASASSDGMVRVWAADQVAPRSFSLQCPAEVLSLAWDLRDGRSILIGLANAKVRIWNLNMPSEKSTIDLSIPPEHAKVDDIACSPNGSTFVTACNTEKRDEGAMYIWKIRSMKPEDQVVVEENVALLCLSFNHNGSILLVGSTDGMIRLFDMTSHTAIMGWRAHMGPVLCAHFSPAETSLYSIGTDGKLLEWNVHSIGHTIRTFEFEGPSAVDGIRHIEIAFDGAGKHFLVPSKNGAILYKLDSSKPAQLLSGHSKPVLCVDWHQNTILTGSADTMIRKCKIAASM